MSDPSGLSASRRAAVVDVTDREDAGRTSVPPRRDERLAIDGRSTADPDAL